MFVRSLKKIKKSLWSHWKASEFCPPPWPLAPPPPFPPSPTNLYTLILGVWSPSPSTCKETAVCFERSEMQRVCHAWCLCVLQTYACDIERAGSDHRHQDWPDHTALPLHTHTQGIPTTHPHSRYSHHYTPTLRVFTPLHTHTQGIHITTHQH